MKDQIRYSADATICIVETADSDFRVATQHDMDTLAVGPDLTEEEIDQLES